MPTIRIDDDVFAGLQKLAQPFTDTPNTVIRRLLEQAGGVHLSAAAPTQVTTRTAPAPSKKKKGTPQPVYEQHLLQTLAADFEGIGHKHEVSAAVIAKMEKLGLVPAHDLEVVSTGETRAENTIAWARNALKDRGLIGSSSPRGIWELTEQGKKEAARMGL